MDLNLLCDSGRRFGDDGAFPAYSNMTYSFVFAVGSQGYCHVTLFNRSQGGGVLRASDILTHVTQVAASISRSGKGVGVTRRAVDSRWSTGMPPLPPWW